MKSSKFLGVILLLAVVAVLGVIGYVLTRPKVVIPPPPQINKIGISADKKSILNTDTKTVIFTIADTQKYLKNAGYFYNPDTFQTTNAKYEGDCFLAAALSNNKDRIVFSTGCLPGDLPQAWVGVYNIHLPSYSCPKIMFGEGQCKRPPTIFNFLATRGGRNFVWSVDDKTITYEADLGLSGMTETRTIDSATGEILSKTITNRELGTSLVIKGADIYLNDIKAGSVDGEIINIFLKNRIFSFKGDINKINLFMPNENYIVFSYNDLYISDGLYRPNSTKSPAVITYKCSGPLRNLENIKYNYCKTNGKDYLTQYEFSDLTSSGFGTGGGTSWRWYKLYIKKINGVDYVFQGYIDKNWVDGPFFNSKNDEEKYKKLSTKEYLDSLLNDKNIQNKIKEWDDFVNVK